MKRKMIGLILLVFLLSMLTVGCDKEPTTEPAETTKGASYTEITPADLQGILKVEDVSPYTGVYIETEEKDRVENAMALRFTNVSDQTILLAEMIFTDGEKELYFTVEMLPVGNSVILVELNKTPATKKAITLVNAAVNYLEEGIENRDCVKITGEEYGVLNITNLTEETLPGVWVFYRRTTPQGDQLGGPCHSCMVVDLAPGATDNPEAPHWSAENCVIVNVLVIDPNE